MGKRLDINVTFQNADELERIKNLVVSAVNEVIARADLSEPGVTVEVDVVDDNAV